MKKDRKKMKKDRKKMKKDRNLFYFLPIFLWGRRIVES